jgi:hypothetical protein
VASRRQCLCIYTINLHDGYVVLVEMQHDACKGAHVDGTDHMCLSGLDIEFGVLRIVDQSGIWDRNGIWRNTRSVILRNENWRFVVVPVRNRRDDFSVDLAMVRVERVVNNQRPTQTIRVLSAVMAVVPVCSWLLDLVELDSGNKRENR